MKNEEIYLLAELAAIEIKAEEIDDIREALTHIMRLMDQLQTADLPPSEQLEQPLDARQTLRGDCISETNEREILQSIAPHTDHGFYIVPPVLK